MPITRAFGLLATTLALGASAPALADTVVLTPLVPARGVSAERVQDLLTLMSAELEFMEGVDEVVQVDARPAALDAACLGSTRCLGAITREHHGDALIAGAIEARGSELLVDLVYYRLAENKVVRRRTHTLPADPSALIDGITPMLHHALTGELPGAEKERLAGADFASGVDDFQLEPEPVRPAAPVAAPAPAPAPSRTTTTTGTARAVNRPIQPAPEPPPPDDDFDPNAFSFESSPEDVSFGPSSTGAASTAPVTSERRTSPPPSRSRYEDDDPLVDPYDEIAEQEYGYDEDEDDWGRTRFDEPRARTSTGSSSARSSSSRNSTTTKTDWRDPKGYRVVQILPHIGWAQYGRLNFLALGGELQVRLYKGLYLDAGVDWYGAKFCGAPDERHPGPIQPREICGEEGKVIKPASISPLHVGIQYRILDKRVKPYVGADFLASHLGAMEVDGFRIQKWAVGGRARLGADIYFIRNVGLNVDAAVGYWSGDGWTMMEVQGQPPSGLVPQLSAGIVAGF